jgi:squalene-hopene/tetraprenyl-beta-curcumene cyclase
MIRTTLTRCVAFLAICSIAVPLVHAAAPTDAEKRGLAYYVKTQNSDGSWLPQIGPAVTALVVECMVQAGTPLTDPTVAKALAYIDKFHKKDGGYYLQGQQNYTTSCVLSMFAALPQDAAPAYHDRIVGAQNFLKSLQRIEGTTDADGKQITKENTWYGGSGYGEDRPDLSNTSFFIEALRDSGVPSTDPAIQKALVFVSRAQMDEKLNPQPFTKGATDGGFIYTPVNGGDSKFGDVDQLNGDAILRSYGSMTYSGLKSFIYAGLTKDDPRVIAAVGWIKSNWTLDANPGAASQDGLFYYYHTFAKALRLYGQDTITDTEGKSHNWRAELTAELEKRQQKDGSWKNAGSPRWYEAQPQLTTAYCILALQEARR